MSIQLPDKLELRRVLLRLDSLERALVDTCALLYMSKSGLLYPVAETVTLVTIPQVVEELGGPCDGVLVERPVSSTGDADMALFAQAEASGLAVISEDGRLLQKLNSAGLEHYNSLMMLHLLLLRSRITADEHRYFVSRIESIARYGSDVWNYGFALFEEIIACPFRGEWLSE